MNNNYPESVEKIVNDYLSRLKEHLNGLPEKDQAEFIKEIASHIYESYTSEECEDGVERILSVLKKLGEPSTVFSQKIPAKMVHKGKEKNLPLYILSGVLIGLFGIPLGISGIAIVISMIGTIFALLVAYFATAISLVVAGFLGIVASIIRLIDPVFFDQFFHWFDWNDSPFYFSSPVAEGILGIGISLIIAGIGVAMFFFGKYIFRGLKFFTNLIIDKLKNFRKKAEPSKTV